MLMTATRTDPAPLGNTRGTAPPIRMAIPLMDTFKALQVFRWLSEAQRSIHTHETPADSYLISVSLRATRLELRSGLASLFEGALRAGALIITGPGQRLNAELRGPCDLVHLQAPTALLRERILGMGGAPDALDSLDCCRLSDPLVEQLARLLLAEGAGSDPVYGTSIAQTLLTRVLHRLQNRSPVGALAKWRLRRVQAMVESQLDQPLTLSDLAAAAGLSRMHFAAQFRAATGSSPHEYLLCQRIEAAKGLLCETDTGLAEIALCVGFLGQAHFTTVFKRLTGEPPARWRRTLRETERAEDESPAAWRNRNAADYYPLGASG